MCEDYCCVASHSLIGRKFSANGVKAKIFVRDQIPISIIKVLNDSRFYKNGAVLLTGFQHFAKP